MMKIKLEFQSVAGNPPVQTCNFCGEKLPVAMSARHPSDDDILIVVCSEDCAIKANDSPDLHEYLEGLYLEVQRMKVKGAS